jgi:translation initiation factor IF-3
MRFKGRELSRQELGKKVLDRLVSELADVAKVEIPPKMEGRQMIMILMAV